MQNFTVEGELYLYLFMEMHADVSINILNNRSGWGRIMEEIVKRISSSLTYIGQFCRQHDAVESFETVKNSNGQYKKSFESTDFLAFHFLKNNLDTVPYYNPSFQICFLFICVSMCRHCYPVCTNANLPSCTWNIAFLAQSLKLC